MISEIPSPERLLTWYDKNARNLPWRVPPHLSRQGIRADAYHVWLSEIMLQQTTVAAVIPYFETFTGRWPSIKSLAAAKDADVMAAWAGLGYYARARNLLKCARQIVTEHDQKFPEDQAGLCSLPGVGPYTSAAVSAIAFNRPAVVVDGNVERVMARINAVDEPLPAAKKTLRKLAADLTPAERCGDYAQAVMDLGATICTPRAPECWRCPWKTACKSFRSGIAEQLPRKSPKPQKPVRHGIAYAVFRQDGAVLLETRPDTGLLGGMLGLPCSEWTIEQPPHQPPFEADWTEGGVEVRHTFTHFHLRLKVVRTLVPDMALNSAMRFFAPDEDPASRLPTVMRKALLAVSQTAPELRQTGIPD